MSLVYWDSSAMVAVCCNDSSAIASIEKHQQHCTRNHTFAEVFSQLTGGRPGRRFLPADAAAILRHNLANFTFVELTTSEILGALAQAQKVGSRRPSSRLPSCNCGEKAGANFICTYNASDFSLLTDLPVGLF